MRFTPGAVLTTDEATVCVTGYSATVRNVTEATKNKIYALYGITSHAPKEFEIDHDISLEIGGSNDPKNLWPESYITWPWNAHVKDKLENYLHKLVCTDKTITLAEAQAESAATGGSRTLSTSVYRLERAAAGLDVNNRTVNGRRPRDHNDRDPIALPSAQPGLRHRIQTQAQLRMLQRDDQIDRPRVEAVPI